MSYIKVICGGLIVQLKCEIWWTLA